ncbi:ATP-binding protein [Muricomes intestini]|uniref:DNA replication protein DnaC n=1 Tax=Muricomes intestini TaxID=1796634 RepID=A0A4R3KDK8_9FIRM|nr:ATP-binding protein [Muricomes intestini]TCS81185.1 DNA replication protein DnaC [Muricomes intestini]HAX52503.1 DNA replication protein DnaC [Lachnospiraceae bacterium]HCR81809.1 DNA replication protein DnaC [Lachnospiraceae bacterium]
MGLKTSQYQTIMRGYEQKQLHSRDILQSRYEEVCRKLPEFKALDNSISVLSVQYGKKLLGGDERAIDSLKEELATLRNSKQELLDLGGFPGDYLEPVYECKDCHDTGYIGNQKCHCFKKSVIGLLYEQSNLKGVLRQENFDTFSLDYYSANYVDSRTGRSSLQVIQDALLVCHNFVDAFKADFQNLFLYGDVGVGKTFLSNCIAKELMDMEFSVLYFSASKFFSILAKSTFDKNDVDAQNMYEYIFDCDLLIIDDLGTEFTNSFIASQFFTCINERLLSRKSTIISTNLSLDTLADLYTERTFSRITSNYTMLRLIGDDIRIKKKLKNREEQSCYTAQKEL